ncbi:MAG: CHASE domain-containing protein [Gallionella sp.]|nr:CHASE domain-containing protein [Gallionella sp.]
MSNVPSSSRVKGGYASAAISLLGRVRVPGSWIAWLVLFASLAATTFSWRIVQHNGHEVARAQFDERSGDVVAQIQQRLHTYEYVLRGGAALFAASGNVKRDEWRAYMTALQIDQQLTGVQGVGFARRIVDYEKDAHIAHVRAEGFPGYTIAPAGPRSEYTPVVYLEPFSGRNLRAFGYDMSSEPSRRAAMERARDTGEIAITGKVILVQETDKKVQYGFLMYFPVYKNGQPHATPAARRAALLGYVFSPFRMNDLMEGVVGRRLPDLDIHIYDGDGVAASSLMFESAWQDHSNHEKAADFSSKTLISVGGHPWTVSALSLPSFDTQAARKSPVIILFMGALISLLLFFSVRGQERSRRHAVSLAERMTQAYKVSELNLQAILDNSPYLAWFKDTEGRYIKVNSTYASYVRLKNAQQVIGKNDFDLWPKALAEKYRRDDAEVMAQRQQKHIEEASLDGDKMHWAETFKTPVIDENGRVLGTTGFARDITERKQKEAEIARLNRTYRLLSQVNEAIVRSHDRGGLFSTICRVAVESGLFRLAWIGMLDQQQVVPVAHAGVEEGYLAKLHIRLDDELTREGPTATALRNGTHGVCQDIQNDPKMQPWRDEALQRGYRASGVFSIFESGAVVGAISVYAGEINFFTPDIIQSMLELAADVSFALDVFAGKKLREQVESELNQLNLELDNRVRERTHQLEVVNQELEAFSYSVSHDLRAPLRSIDGFSQILSKKYHDSLDDTGRDYLERVRRASQRMGQLIDDLLRLAQVTRSPLKREQIDLSAIAEQVADDLRNTNPGRVVQFTVQEGLIVRADPGLLRIVINNLLGNAFKFTGKQADAKIEFGICDCNGESAFFIRDNGAGFNMGYAHKLFGAFQRLHGVNEFEGTGIGLATVQRIVRRHHGRVWAEAKEGQGATFYFTLPQRMRER